MTPTVSAAAADSFPIPRRFNLAIVAVQLAAMFAIFLGAAHATNAWQLAGLAAAFAVVGNSVYSIIHEAEHRMLHPNAAINDALGVFMALFFPAPYHLLRQGHLCHHRANRSDDEAFDLYFDGDLPAVKWLKFYGIITGVYWILVVASNVAVLVFPFLLKRKYYEFDQHFAKFVEVLNPKYRWLIQAEALAAIVLHTAIVFALNIPLANYAIVYFGFGFSWSAMQYVHHFGAERHVVRGTRNLWLFTPIDALWLHHNWHLTHHRQPTVPWIYLPSLGRSQDPQRGFLVWHYLKMWRGPRHTSESVKNHFTGQVSK
jgi:fatty acid desaturase